MHAHPLRHPEPINLLGRRSRTELMDVLLRAHRIGDKALVRTCQAELDSQSKVYLQSARIASGQRR